MGNRELIFMGAVAVSSLCQTGSRHSPTWRGEQELLIAHAIVQDLVRMPRDEGATPPTAFCVYGRSDALGDSDPDGRLVASLREQGVNAYPISQCAAWKVVATGEEAYVVGVAALQWWDDAFVKAEGEQARGILAGGTWLYTLSRGDSGWTVDTVRGHKIY